MTMNDCIIQVLGAIHTDLTLIDIIACRHDAGSAGLHAIFVEAGIVAKSSVKYTLRPSKL